LPPCTPCRLNIYCCCKLEYIHQYRFRSFCMNRLQSILVAVDFSPASDAALRQALRLARCNNARLHLLHVINQQVFDDLLDALPLNRDQLTRQIRQHVTDKLQSRLADLEVPQDTQIEIIFGSVLNEVLRRVKQTAADLLLLGVKSNGHHTDRGAGMLATKCVRKAETKVMLLRPEHAQNFRNIVATVDFAANTPAVIEQAVRIAMIEKSRLHLLHVYDSPWRRLHYGVPNLQADPEYQDKYKNSLNEMLKKTIEPHQQDLADIDITCQLIEDKDFARGIIDYAGQNNAELVVIGTRGRTHLHYVLLGSTAEQVLRDTPCSVLAIKPEDFTLALDKN